MRAKCPEIIPTFPFCGHLLIRTFPFGGPWVAVEFGDMKAECHYTTHLVSLYYGNHQYLQLRNMTAFQDWS